MRHHLSALALGFRVEFGRQGRHDSLTGCSDVNLATPDLLLKSRADAGFRGCGTDLTGHARDWYDEPPRFFPVESVPAKLLAGPE
jgi:hypothetical protein